MGVVRKQSVLSSVYIYIGFAIGALNMFLLPQFLDQDQVGLTRIIISVSTLLAGICNLGTLPVITRFFPYYKDHAAGKKNDLLSWVLLLNLAGFAAMVLLSVWFRFLIIRKFSGNSPLFIRYFDVIYPFTFFLIFYNVLENYSWNQQRTVYPNFLREAGVRIFVLLLILGVGSGFLPFDRFIGLFSLQFGVVFVLIAGYLLREHLLTFSFRVSKVTRRFKLRMIQYAGFVFGGNLLLLLEQNISVILIGSIRGLNQSAIFDIANFIATVLVVPKRSVQAIATPLISEAWKNNDRAKVQELYAKSSLNLLIAGTLILGLILLNLNLIFGLLPANYAAGKWVVVVVGLANLVDLATGLNYQVLVNSRFWKLDFYLSMGQVALFLAVNYLLVKRFGMLGSAYSMLLSMISYNGVRYLLIFLKFGFQPFDRKTAAALLMAVSAFAAAWILPLQSWHWMGSVFRSVLFVLIFGGLILGFHVSHDFQDLYHIGWRRLRGRK